MIPPCYPPDEPIYVYAVRADAQGNPILDFQDPNQPRQVTGYNSYRSSNPALPPGSTWYDDVAAYNHNCLAAGPC